jgi:predicted house-cleaning NTP pyrophosphatase (Maf/HAM1 superfamily)
MGGLKFYNFCSKDTVKFKVITKNKITYYFKIHHIDDTIGLYDNDMNLIKTIKGVI